MTICRKSYKLVSFPSRTKSAKNGESTKQPLHKQRLKPPPPRQQGLQMLRLQKSSSKGTPLRSKT
jgi:hypothetical protein